MQKASVGVFVVVAVVVVVVLEDELACARSVCIARLTTFSEQEAPIVEIIVCIRRTAFWSFVRSSGRICVLRPHAYKIMYCTHPVCSVLHRDIGTQSRLLLAEGCME